MKYYDKINDEKSHVILILYNERTIEHKGRELT